MKLRDGGAKDGWKMEVGQGEKRVEEGSYDAVLISARKEWKGKESRGECVPCHLTCVQIFLLS